MKRILTAALIGAALFFTAACGIQQNVVLSGDGSGTARLTVRLQRAFVAYMTDVAGAFYDEAEAGGRPFSLFDLDRIRENLGTRPGVRIISLASPSAGELNMELSFTDVTAILRPGQNGQASVPSNVLSFSSTADGKSLVFRLNSATVEQLAQSTPGADVFEAMGLGPGDDITRAEYVEMLEFVLEDYLQRGEQVRALIDASAVDVTIQVNGRLISQTGGRQNGNSVTFHIPLLDLLFPARPTEYSVRFR